MESHMQATQNTVYFFIQLVDDFAYPIAENVCSRFMNASSCTGYLNRYIQSFLSNFFDHYSDGSFVCSYLNICKQEFRYLNISDFAQEVLSDKPKSKDKKAKDSRLNSSTFTIAHMSDVHINPHYAVGSDAFCDESNCCQEMNGFPSNKSRQAQYWGTVAACDLPVRTANETFRNIKELNPDIIIWTGDNMGHNEWEQFQSNQTVTTKILTDLIKEQFPGKTIYPMFGNHETFPTDEYHFDGKSQWLLNEVGAMWKDYLDEAAMLTFLTGGYYTMWNDQYKFRIVALNTQVCDVLNFNLMKNSTDRLDELAWLRATLYKAETNLEPVYIMGHIPPGDIFCHAEWSERYQIIIERFSDTIKGQFFAHTHNDHFQVTTGYYSGKPESFWLITPSVTTSDNYNPSFRIIYLNNETKKIEDYDQYRLNITLANQLQNKSLHFDKIYTFKSLYNITEITSESLTENDDNLLQIYVRNFYSAGLDYEKMNGKISAKEKTKQICFAQSPDFKKLQTCLGYSILEHPQILTYAFLQFITGKWNTMIEQKDSHKKSLRSFKKH